MKLMLKVKIFLFASIIGFTGKAISDEQDILFQARPGQSIKDSRFGPIMKFQQGLISAAKECNIDSTKIPPPDHILGPKVTQLIQLVSVCTNYPSLAGTAAATKGAVTELLWKLVSPDVPIPTVVQRAYILAGGNEATDYTDIEFNLGTTDPGILTWGPQGATSGQAFQVQRILQKIDANNPNLINAAFDTEAPAIRRFASTKTEATATLIVQDVMNKISRKASWVKGFSKLGESVTARAIYDSIMNAKGTAGMPEAIADFYRSYWSQCWQPTEVDYAFFLDRAIQMDIRQTKTDAAIAAVVNAETRLKKSFSPALRRRAISANFQGMNSSMVGDRLARDVVFYIDAIPEADLTDASLFELRSDPKTKPAQLTAEIEQWKKRTGQKASDFGLTDARYAAVPDKLANKEPACIVSRSSSNS